MSCIPATDPDKAHSLRQLVVGDMRREAPDVSAAIGGVITSSPETIAAVIGYLATVVAEGIERGYGGSALDEVNRELSAEMLSADSTEPTT